jgi:hypothetical protein
MFIRFLSWGRLLVSEVGAIRRGRADITLRRFKGGEGRFAVVKSACDAIELRECARYFGIR